MRVGFFGNNLNQGYLAVEALRRAGHEAVLFDDVRSYAQDTHDWWTSRPRDRNWVVETGVTQGDLTLEGPLTAQPAIRATYERAAQCDVLILREYGPALFSELDGPRKVFWSSGSDLQLLPFLEDLRPPRPWYRQWFGKRPQDVVIPVGAVELTAQQREAIRYRQEDLIQARQRAGLEQCAAWILMPYQKPLALRLGISTRRIHHWHMLMDDQLCDEVDGDEVRRLADRYRHEELVLFHPARQFFLRLDRNPFLKDNDKLFVGFREFLHRTRCRARLVAVKKGRAADLERIHALVKRLGLEPHLDWVGELPNRQLRAYYALPNVVVCDQFSPHLPTMGNTGREATMFGRLLVTSYDRSNDDLHPDDPPPHIFPAATADDVGEGLAVLYALGAAERQRRGAAGRAWAQRHLTAEALVPRVERLLRSLVGDASDADPVTRAA